MSCEENGVTEEQKAKEERIAASLRQREEHLRQEDTTKTNGFTNQQRVKLVSPDPIMEMSDLAPSSQKSSFYILPKRAAKTAAINGMLKNLPYT